MYTKYPTTFYSCPPSLQALFSCGMNHINMMIMNCIGMANSINTIINLINVQAQLRAHAVIVLVYLTCNNLWLLTNVKQPVIIALAFVPQF